MRKLRESIRLIAIRLRHAYFTGLLGMDIATSARISFGTRLDKTNPKGIHIGEESYTASGAIIFTHDFCRGDSQGYPHRETVLHRGQRHHHVRCPYRRQCRGRQRRHRDEGRPFRLHRGRQSGENHQGGHTDDEVRANRVILAAEALRRPSGSHGVSAKEIRPIPAHHLS